MISMLISKIWKQIFEWNANELSNHTEEVKIFFKSNFINILLVSETHFTYRKGFKIHDLIVATRPDNRAQFALQY